MLKIKEYEIFIYNLEKYYNSHTNKQQKSNYLAYFLFDTFLYIKRFGIDIFIKELHHFNKDGMDFELCDFNIDSHTQNIYITEAYHNYRTKNIDLSLSSIELCKKNLIKSSNMTKDNFIHLLFAWDKIVNALPPFALLYQDDQGWYDVLPFDTQETMEQFIADHTAIEDIHE